MKNTHTMSIVIFFTTLSVLTQSTTQAKLNLKLNQTIVPHMKSVDLVQRNAEDQGDLKPARIIRPSDFEAEGMNGMSNRPNYLSNVITRKPTSTIIKRGAPSDGMTYDLDQISKFLLKKDMFILITLSI